MPTNTITIPQQLTKMGDLVIIPRKEYKALLEFKKIKEFTPSLAQKNALLSAERNFHKGKTLSYHALTQKLGIAH